MGWIVGGILLVLLAMMPIRLLIAYSLQGVSVKLKAGLLTFSVLPRKPKTTQKKENEAGETAAAGSNAEKQTTKREKPDISAYLRVLKLVLDLLIRLRNKAVMKRFDFLLILAGDDPSDLAVLYGRTQGAFAVLFGQIEAAFNIHKRNIRIECDFTADKTVFEGFTDISITFGRLFYLAARYGTVILKEYFTIINNKKAVQ